MKYTKPMLEIVKIEAQDILTSSIEEQGSITSGEITITGPANEFSQYFEDLVAN